MRRWLRDLDHHTAGLDVALGDLARMMRQVADDPDKVDATLRDHLRQAASLVEQLGRGQKQLIEFNRRSVIRFGILSGLFVTLLAFNVVSVFFR